MIRIAIDGPAGVGKSSTSRALAKHFGYAYLDTGAMYRAAAWWCLHQGIDLDAEKPDEQQIFEAVGECFANGHVVLGLNPDNPTVSCDGEDISTAIRTAHVSSHVSIVSSIIPVRHILIEAQRAYLKAEAADDSYSHGSGIVAEGRDITTVVAPDAEVRILMTARPEVRQARRNGQTGTGNDDVAKRDAADSQVTNFLTASDGVTTVDNSDMNFTQTLNVLITLVDKTLDEQLYATYAANLNDYELDDNDEQLIDQANKPLNTTTEEPTPVGVLAIVGRPNVGKSTLVNRILGRRAAIVEDTPGITRDRISYDAEWAGTHFRIVDTGGWETNVEGIDSAIATQAQTAVHLSDAVILVVDGTVGITKTDQQIVTMLREAGKPVTIAVNKIDTTEQEYETAEFWKLGLGEPLGISAMHGRGIGDLLDTALTKLKKAEKTSGYLTPEGLRRIAIIGRPNVGKSSLLNQLAHEQRTVVDNHAGTTRDPVDEIIHLDGQDWLFIDTAGIKRRQHKLTGTEYYSSLRTQAAIERAELALILFDISQPISDQDLKVMSQAVDTGRAIVLVFNKWDLHDEYTRARLERLWQTEFYKVEWAQRINLSAKTGWHTNRLANAMRTALNSWDQRIPTGRLNAFLGQLQAAHPHPIRGGKQPRILFATQAGTRPPRFVIFTTGFIDHSYRRFIERSLRDQFGFQGTPIQISIRVREKKNKK